jgi:pimeloyl-ACP methyl ester carboxylesterase
MPRYRVHGAELAYRDYGAGEPVLLLHPGFVADGMLPLVAAPALSGFRLVAYHRRGYGGSDRVTGTSGVPEQAADALALLDALGVARAHFVGMSMGAVVAIQAALDSPERVGTLALLEPLLGFALDPVAAAFVADTAQAALPRFAAGDHEGALDAWLTGAFGPGFRAVLDRSLPGSWTTAVRDAGTAFGVELPALQAWRVGPDDLGRLGVPTLSLVHSGDRWPGFEQIHRHLIASIPGCEAAVVDVPSHLLHMADPGAVAEPLAAFLGRHPIAPG